MRDNTVQGVMPGSPKSLEGRNSINTSLNGASEESIGIYAKSRCQWSGEASIGASSLGLPHPCESVSGWLHKWS